MDLGRIGDEVGQQTVLPGVCAEVGAVVLLEAFESLCLPVGEHQGSSALVKPVGSELRDHPLSDLGFTGALELRGDIVGGAAQIISGVIRTEVGTMTVHRTVLHQAARLEQLLAAGDLGGGEQHLTGFVDDLVGHGH